MRILVVEDEKEIADGLLGILKNEGYSVDVTYNGEEGFYSIMSGIYDLILLDVMLPNMNGFEILKKVRSKGIDVPIILLTAKTQTEDKIHGLDFGADDYLTKPFEVGELLARIRAIFRRNMNIKDNILSAFDIELDVFSYQLKKNYKAVKLSKIEYKILESLMMNKDQILEKETLISKIWGFDEYGDYNSLEVYVSFIRKKLKFLEANACIITKKGVGYYLAFKEK